MALIVRPTSLVERWRQENERAALLLAQIVGAKAAASLDSCLTFLRATRTLSTRVTQDPPTLPFELVQFVAMVVVAKSHWSSFQPYALEAPSYGRALRPGSPRRAGSSGPPSSMQSNASGQAFWQTATNELEEETKCEGDDDDDNGHNSKVNNRNNNGNKTNNNNKMSDDSTSSGFPEILNAPSGRWSNPSKAIAVVGLDVVDGKARRIVGPELTPQEHMRILNGKAQHKEEEGLKRDKMCNELCSPATKMQEMGIQATRRNVLNKKKITSLVGDSPALTSFLSERMEGKGKSNKVLQLTGSPGAISAKFATIFGASEAAPNVNEAKSRAQRTVFQVKKSLIG